MGQYFFIANLDKEEYLHPHYFDNGLKLMEFSLFAPGVMTGLAILLADGNGRGVGDLNSNNPIVGSWAGDRIVIIGDYADSGLFNEVDNSYTNISQQTLMAMLDDSCIRDFYRKVYDAGLKGYVYEPLMETLKEVFER